MNRLDHLLIILSEEGTELSHETSKALRFGVHERRDLATSNHDRMQTEYNDILAVAEMLNAENEDIHLHRDNALIQAKKRKVENYLLYSADCGRLE